MAAGELFKYQRMPDKEESSAMHLVPFLLTSDYFLKVLDGNPERINRFWEIQDKYPELNKDHDNLHIYPYVQARPAILSLGCNNQCVFCPTATIFHGKVFFGDPEFILPHYENQNVHFLDENFFLNDMDKVLPLLRRYNIKWLAMSHFDDVMRVYRKYGEDYLFACGLRVVELGLENISLMRKVEGNGVPNKSVEIFYLNLTFLPNETKETIQQTARWMITHGLRNPIYHYNGLWYSPGQYYFPYGKEESEGVLLETKYARVVPTYIPYTFLNQEIVIEDADLVNKYAHLIYSKDYVLFPTKREYRIGEFIGNDYRKAMWVVVGIRVGGIV